MNWTLTFAAANTGVTASNFSLSGAAATGAIVSTSTTANGGLTWNVPVTTGSSDGTLTLSLVNTIGTTPGVSTSLPFAGESYTMDKTAPTIGIGAPSVSTIAAGAGSVTYTVTYTDTHFSASTLANGNITLNSTGTANGTVGVSGSGNTRTVTISSITGAGTIGISIVAGTASDTAGNSAPAVGPSTPFAVTAPAPTVSLSTANLLTTATTLTITGTGFSTTPGNNTVAFTPAGSGTVTASTATSLTVTSLTGLSLGALNAVATTNGQSSGAAVQVATVVAPGPGDLDPLDPSVVGGYVKTTAVQPDGKTVLGGQFTSVLGVTRNNIARLNANGTLDTAFDPNTNGQVNSVVVQSNGQILLGGFFTSVGGTTRNKIARVDGTTGALDSGFNPNANTEVNSVVVQADGKILLGGAFTTVGGISRNGIARVDGTTGALDTVFNPGAANSVVSVAVQADGNILLGGSFTNVGGTARNHIARVDGTTGALDPFFNIDVTNTVYSVAVQANGKILLGGSFTSIGVTTRKHIARVDATTGALDTGFNPNVSSDVYSMAVQADGKILFGGSFSTVGVTTRNKIARVDAAGALDTGFNPNANSTVLSVAVQADGQVLLGGFFASVGGTARNRFARLLNDPATQTLSAVDATQVLWTRGGSSPEASQVTFEQSTDSGATWTPLDIGTRIGTTAIWQLTGLALTGSGQLRARGRTAGGYQNGSSGLVESVASFSFAAPQVSIAATTPTAVEGGATGVYTFTRDSTAGALVANFQLNAGSTATAGTDFTLTGATSFNSGTGAGTITFPDTVATVTVTLPALTESPNAAEAAETAQLDVATGSGYTIGSPADATVTITANSFLVTTTNDAGEGSLRQAIDNANAIAGADSITFSDGTGGTVNFTDATADIIDLATVLPSLTTDLTINGTGADKITVRRPAGAATNFGILNVNSTAIVNLSGLTLTGGINSGGGIRNNGTVTVTACAVIGNTAGTSTGGGIYSVGHLTVHSSTISGNTAGQGGGVYSSTAHGPFTAASTGTILVNTTLSGNSVTGGSARGGGLYNFDGLTYLVNCTLTGNSAPATSGFPTNTGGGGVATFGDSGTETRFANTLCIGNTASDVDVSPNTTISNTSLGGNLIGTGNSSANFTGQTTAAAASTIVKSTLANNGGSTLTHALVVGSPALNTGINANATNPSDAIFGDGNDVPLITDQRGSGFTRALGQVDIGAFEQQTGVPEINIQGNGVDIVNGDTTPSITDHTDFSSVAVAGAAQVARSFTLQNLGNAVLNLTGSPPVAISGPNATDFFVSAFTTTVSPGSTTIGINFNPTASGLRTAIVSIETNDADETPYTFTIQGTGLNSAPTDLVLTNASVNENSVANANIGLVLTTDPDSSDTHTLNFVTGTGDTDNAAFNLSGNTLRLTASADFETKSSYSVRLQADDGNGGTYSEPFLVIINNVNEIPSFTKGADQTHVFGTTTAQSISGWATSMDDGDSTVTQSLSFHVTNTNNALFSNPPSIAPNGTLTYTPNGSAGTATVSVSLTDDNSINGNAALTSAVQTFTITVQSAADYSVSTTATGITVNDVSGHGDVMLITEPAAGLMRFAVVGRTFSVNGGLLISGDSGNLPLAGVTAITVNAGMGDDRVTVNAFSGTSFPSLTINGGTGDDRVVMNGSITFAANRNLDLDLQNDDAPVGSDLIDIGNDAELNLSGTGSVTMRCSAGISVTSGSINAQNGNIVMEANMQPVPVAVSPHGILLQGSVSCIGTGSITLRGRQGTANGTGVVIAQNVTGGALGALFIEGFGAAVTTGDSKGVTINSVVSTFGAPITINGTGGGGDDSNAGVQIAESFNGSTSIIGGSAVNITGTAGAITSPSSHGLDVEGAGTLITSNGGDVTLSGTDPNTRQGGLFVREGTMITNDSNGAVTLIGSGSSGVHLWGSVTSADGNITITGTGGAIGSNTGIILEDDSEVRTDGQHRKITMNGTTTSPNGEGIDFNGIESSIHVSSHGGNILLSGSSIRCSETLFDSSLGSLGNGSIAFDTSHGLKLIGATSVTTHDANVTFTAAAMDIASTATVTAGLGTVELHTPNDATTKIHLGAADAANILGLTDAELDRITAATLGIYTEQEIHLTDVISRSTGGLTLNATNGSFFDGGKIELTAGACIIGNGVTPNTMGTEISAPSITVNGIHHIAINGTTPDAGYHQLKLNGTINFSSSALSLTGSHVPVAGNVFTLIDNDGTDPVTGTFSGQAEGSTLTFNGVLMRISYLGGTGNDVVLAPANTAPVATNDTLGTEENKQATVVARKYTLNDSDPDNDPLTITGVSNSSTQGGSVSLSGGNIIYTPATGFVGSDQFNYTLSDGHGGTATATVFVSVTSKNAVSKNSTIAQTANGFELTFAGVPGNQYIIQYSADLINWQNLVGPVPAGTNGLIEYTDNPQPAPPTRFYRTIAAPAP